MNIKNAKMILSNIGKIAEKYWREIPIHFPHVKLDEYIIMPNHIHGIVQIKYKPVETQNRKPVETQNFASLHVPNYNQFGPQSKNLASIIRGYKIGVKQWTKMNYIIFNWQSRYYDHIIRTEKSLNIIRQYIKNNPKNWYRDRNNKNLPPSRKLC